MPPDRLQPDDGALVRALGVRAMAANIVNSIVGSGIFVLPAAVAVVLGPTSMVAYLVCAVAMGLVAMCFAEAGSRVSLTGGTYAYIETAFGPFVGFLAGVLFWFGCQVLASAAVATVLVGSLATLVPAAAGGAARAALFIALYATLAAVNIRGVRTGARLVEVVTVAKLAPLLLLLAGGLLAVRPEYLRWTQLPTVADIGRASLVLIFAFTGTEGALTPSGEVKSPARTVPRAIIIGLGAVTALYVGVQVTAQGVLGPELVTYKDAPLAAAAGRVFGGWGGALMLVGATVSTFGWLSGDMLATPRVLFAFARDGFVPARVGAVHARFRTPYVSIVIHAAVACAFALTGSFGALAVLSVVAVLPIYLACCLATLELRRRDVRTDGVPFRLRGGPTVPVLASLVVLWLLSSATGAELASVGAVLAVASVLYLLRRARRLVPPGAVVES